MKLSDQPTLPFEGADFTPILRLDDSAILDGSLAIAGFDWGGLTGEVFPDGGVCFHDGDEIQLDNSEWPYYLSDERILENIKKAHDIKVGKIPEDVQ